jgi:putative addiction module component (TIGR02574 family)
MNQVLPRVKVLKMIADLRELPIGERIRLVEDLWDSIAADQAVLPLTVEQRTELNLRLDAYESDGVKGRVASEIIADIRKKL